MYEMKLARDKKWREKRNNKTCCCFYGGIRVYLHP